MSSLSREREEEICKYIKDNVTALFGQKFWECRYASAVIVQQKNDRWESRFLAIAKFRVFILCGKTTLSLKVERTFNILALRYIELMQQENLLQLGWEERPTKPLAMPTLLHILVRFAEGREKSARDLAMELLATLKHYFPEIQRSLAKHFLVIPPSLVVDFPSLPTSTPELPCHNFRRSYVAYCDWADQPFRDEVIWDIERIYFVHGHHELDLNDFSHLTAKDQYALIGAIQFSDFFTGISADSLRFQSEHIDALLSLLRRSHSLKSLQINRCNLPKDFLSQLATTLALNTLPLERFKLAGVPLEDKKGLAQLATILTQLPSFHSLYLIDCSLNEKSMLSLLNGFHHGVRMTTEKGRADETEGIGSHGPRISPFQLKALDLSGNQLGASSELAEQLANLVALSNGTIRLLDLSGTALQLDRLWDALKLGGLGLEVLRLSGCYSYSGSSSGKRSGAKDRTQIVQEFFSSICSLRELNLSNTHVGSEILQGILSGLSANQQLPASTLHLCLDSAIVNSAPCVSSLEHYISDCACIGSLSMRDNSLEHEMFRLLLALENVPNLKALDIGGANYLGLKGSKKHAPVLAGILSQLVKIINGIGKNDESCIEELSLADARLGSHLSILLNALGLCGQLRRLDLSNNELGSGGMRLMGKSLQLNNSLRWLSLDRNQIGPEGFNELARALRLNTTLVNLQLPVYDVSESMLALAKSPIDRARFQLVMEEIQLALERNRKMNVAETGPITGNHIQNIIYQLNNGCEKYNINQNGQATELKKIVFHKLSKLVTEMGDQALCDEAPINQSQEDRKFIDQMVEWIEKRTDTKKKDFLQKFILQLMNQEGLEMAVKEDQTIPKELLNDALRTNLMILINKHTEQVAWEDLFFMIDGCLSDENPEEIFRIRGRPSLARSSILSSRKGVQFRDGTDFKDGADHSLLRHRPISAMMNSATTSSAADAMAAVLMSRSVMGNFACDHGDDNEPKVRQMENKTTSSKLVHLAKQRPTPARLNRSRVKPVGDDQGDRGGQGSGNVGEEKINFDDPEMQQNIRRPSGCSRSDTGIATSFEQSLELSPLMRIQRHKHLEDGREEGEPQTSHTPSPPRLPPRREKSSGSPAMTPPKLPPKPLSPKEMMAENESTDEKIK